MTIFTPLTLAQYWDCSEHHVRNLISRGELRAFKLGERLWRIRGEDVEAYQCRNTQLAGSGENSPSSGMTPKAGTVTSLAPATRAKLRDLRHHSMQR